MIPSEQKGNKRPRSPSVITISSDSEDPEGSRVAGPSSRPGKKIKVKGEGKQGKWEVIRAARIQKVEIEIEDERAAIDAERRRKEVAKLDKIIEEERRKIKGGK